jgi:hypothetical protein
LSDEEPTERKKLWKPREVEHTSGALWKYAQQVGPAFDGAVTHPGAAKEKRQYADIYNVPAASLERGRRHIKYLGLTTCSGKTMNIKKTLDRIPGGMIAGAASACSVPSSLHDHRRDR